MGNEKVGLPAKRYFKCGDEQDLKDKLNHLLQNNITKTEQYNLQQQIAEKYNWPQIAQQTVAVYENALHHSKKAPLPISAQSTFG